LLLRYFAVLPALFGAAIFAVHPVHVEAVANVVGRSELISSTFVLLACVLWPRITSRTPRALITAVLYFLAMCAKEGAAVLPALLLLLDFADGAWQRSSIGSYLRNRRWEFGALVLSFALFSIVRFSILGRVAPARLDPTLEVLSSDWHRILTALQAWPLALKVLFFPITLLADYGPRITLPIQEWNSLAVVGATLLLALVGGGTAAILLGHRKTALGLLWYPIAVLPVSNFIIPIGVLFAERTLYLPSIALSFAAAALLLFLSPRVHPRLIAMASMIVVLALGARSMVRVPEWESTDRILLSLVRDRPDAFRGRWHSARMHRTQGDVPNAIREYQQMLGLWPFRQAATEEVATFATREGYQQLARDVSLFGAQQWTGSVVFHRLAAANALDGGDTATAISSLRAGLRHFPNDTILGAMWRAIAPDHEP
jgi:hypothetical protein